MLQRKRLIMIIIGLLAVAAIAFLGGILGKKTARVERKEGEETALRCAYDGIRTNPFYQVDAYLDDASTASFCSIYCATRWFKENRDKVIYFTVIDETTGTSLDSTLAFFVESEVVTVPEVKNRIHAFASEEEALVHAQQFNGKLIENPFGRAFVLPKVAQFDTLRVGAPSLPDALPLKLAVFKPIFKENRLDVKVVPFNGDREAERLLSAGSVDAAICDLPSGILLAKSSPSAQIVKNVLRPNPFRPLFAIVAGPRVAVQDLTKLEGQSIAVPKGVSFRFYAEYYLKSADVPLEKVVILEVEDVSKAWDLLNRGDVSAALLRTPYTDMAMTKNMTFLADDRSLPWMSVLVVKESVIENKPKAVERFLFGLEQAVLALNLKAEKYRVVLQKQGGIPPEARKECSMPIFEAATVPSQDEVEPVLEWLVEKGLLTPGINYEELVNLQFLPNPENVGLAFCCGE